MREGVKCEDISGTRIRGATVAVLSGFVQYQTGVAGGLLSLESLVYIAWQESRNEVGNRPQSARRKNNLKDNVSFERRGSAYDGGVVVYRYQPRPILRNIIFAPYVPRIFTGSEAIMIKKSHPAGPPLQLVQLTYPKRRTGKQKRPAG